MVTIRKLDQVWMLLIALTLGGVVVGEGADPGFWVTLLVAGITAVKGRLVIDYFIEVGDALPSIRRLMRVFGLLVPALIVLTYLFGSQIADVTSL